ncbi:HAMP domain-containing protein [Paenibacillus rhizovicinus]|uniref:HAMP domain-containing protein n=1 Tax=Paenibacillus rhizovicinus TaxID=2704463 RepID=A0A6C0NYY2_9BACL|nr:sensor histidine kinase [Paenibacillus rhizovicinus]QHW31454.1 HAMP domain-containing protein [Paenibacillus rhizovicinus]
MSVVTRDRAPFRRSTQKRLTFFFILPIVPLIFISLYAISQSENIVVRQAGENNRAAISAALGFIDQFTDTAQRLSLQISNDSTLNAMLDVQGSEATMIYEASQILNRLATYKLANDMIQDIWILDTNLGMIISRQHGGKRIDYAHRNWYSQAIAGMGSSVLYIPHATKEISPGVPDPVDNVDLVTFTREMGFNTSNPSSHVVGITVSRQTLTQFALNLLNTKHSQFQILDADNRVIASYADASVSDEAARGLNSKYGFIKLKKHMLDSRVVSQVSGWSIELAQPESVLNQGTRQLQAFIIAISVLSIFLALIVSWIVYVGISAPLAKLLGGIQQIRRGVWDVNLKSKRRDEFGMITDTFNQMAMQQKQYLQDIYTQQVQKTRTELKFLQSQIDPHFLYNTLDSIYASAVQYGADETSEMVLNLSRFFRLSLSKGRDTFTVKETFEHLSYYIRIQEMRFLDHFEWEYQIDEASEPVPILKLLLQPLVENAIIHGLEKAPPGGRLTIAAANENGILSLRVRDTGNGIPEDRLRKIQSELVRNRVDSFNLERAKPNDFYGLTNVCSRLRLYYGNRAEMTIASIAGQWTETTIRIPVEACYGAPPIERTGGENL